MVPQMIFDVPGGRIDLSNLPWGCVHLILCSLRNPRCTPDLVLLLADGMAEIREQMDRDSICLRACARTESALRALAPHFSGAAHATAP